MRCLAEFLDDGYVKKIITTCRESQAVQGILVQIDWRWMYSWRVGEKYDPENPPKGFEEAMRYQVDWREFWDGTPRELAEPWLPYRAITARDLTWRPPIYYWRDEDKETYSKWPIQVRICLYPRSPGAHHVPKFEADGFRIQYEVRSIARLLSGPRSQHRPLIGGVSIGTDPAECGTMGGILSDGFGRFVGVTCAHVADKHKPVDQPAQLDGSGSSIGQVFVSELPAPYPSHARRTTSYQSKHASKVDIALIELGPSPKPRLEVLKMGRLRDTISLDDIEQDEELQITGRTSDWKRLQRGPVAPYYNVKNKKTGDEYCFENALILRDPTGVCPVQPGDSGAWLCKETANDYLWAGMVVGGDSQLGLAIAANELMQWIKTNDKNGKSISVS